MYKFNYKHNPLNDWLILVLRTTSLYNNGCAPFEKQVVYNLTLPVLYNELIPKKKYEA